MGGNKEGGKLSARKIKEVYGEDFYAKIGQIGGKKGTTGGFWHKKYVEKDIDFVRTAGRKGGARSVRKKTKKETT